MKYILIFFLVSTAAFVMPKVMTPTTQDPVTAQTDKVELSPDSAISTAWFETNLDIYIPQEYIPFNPVEYKYALTKGMKDTIGFEYWLGTFTIADMFNENGYTMIDFSKEGHKKLMFITPTFLVLTSYMDADKSTGLTYGATLIYYPEENILQEMENFIVFGVYGDKLDGAFEHYDIGEKKYIEYGQYDVYDGSFTLPEE